MPKWSQVKRGQYLMAAVAAFCGHTAPTCQRRIRRLRLVPVDWVSYGSRRWPVFSRKQMLAIRADFRRKPTKIGRYQN